MASIIPGYEYDIFISYRQKDKGFQWLEKGFARNDCLIIFLDTKPALDPIRSDNRFQDMLKKMNLK